VITADIRQSADTTARRVEGQVVRGTRKGPIPVPGRWVVLHRVGPDRAGPLDSMRTNPLGQYHFRYHASGDTTALYFVSSSYGGIAYFTTPLREPLVQGPDGAITVFDTTSGPVAIKLGGRHLIVGAPQANGRRPVGEVYDLVNDSTVTLIARDSLSPVWTAHLPPGAVNFQVNANGELASSAVVQRGSSVGLYAPLSPGIRQLAFTYELPSSAFPLHVPTETPTGMFEVLVQEPKAIVHGGPLREMAPVSTEGRTFRRFLAQDLPPGAVLQVDVPAVLGVQRERVYLGVGIVVLAAMVIALGFAAWRSMPRFAFAGRTSAEPRSRMLIREIAALDSEYEREPAGTSRDSYESRRSALKAELTRALDAERGTR